MANKLMYVIDIDGRITRWYRFKDTAQAAADAIEGLANALNVATETIERAAQQIRTMQIHRRSRIVRITPKG